jgi:glycosyltransferase involved in cell wall biosynthesis
MGAVPGRWLQERLRKFEASLYRDADHVVTLSPDMERHVLDLGGSPGQVTTLLNGTSFELLDAADPSAPEALRARYGLGRRRVVLYAGSFGRANGLPAVLEAARLLRDREDLIFVFVGSGYARDAVDRAAEAEPNVVSVPPVPKHAIFDWHRLADLSLVTFIDLPVLSTNSPSKFFDSLACGTPVLVTNTGWTRAFVEDHNCGWCIDALSADRLATTSKT